MLCQHAPALDVIGGDEGSRLLLEAARQDNMRHVFFAHQLREPRHFSPLRRPDDDETIDLAGAAEALDALGIASHSGIQDEVILSVFGGGGHAGYQFGEEVGDFVNGIIDEQADFVAALSAQAARGGGGLIADGLGGAQYRLFGARGDIAAVGSAPWTPLTGTSPIQ